ncbi:C40 family peptidase [Jeotgalibacillus proteolyticus]|uniref:Peptidoglycan endopeptidase n=1 Tax=Jeotgalibacillus proteolyticus TaxID=2082395 RepID=A0A2S5G7I0_9BACL|nr:NlpC/P60 family protein [Jeotgalibacillus proteolyticus]PPA68947.1 peptidoglycan endopeptidase [Jeotgalibacillus proteolyticus]
MKKQLGTISLALTLGISSLGAAPSALGAMPSGYGAAPSDQATPSDHEEVRSDTAVAASNQVNEEVENAKADEIISFAKSLIGKATYGSDYSYTYPYQFKCASFIEFIFQSEGIHLGSRDENYMVQQGEYVSRDQLEKGDLVFFKRSSSSTTPNHVGMYIGNNQIIHMANEKLDIVISDLDSTSYYKDNYMTARRVLPSLLPSNPPTKADNIIENAYGLMDEVEMGRVNDEASMKFSGGGYVNYIYKINGIDLGATSVKDLSEIGRTVSRDNLEKGDLIFIGSTPGSTTPSRVAIYAGDSRIIVPSSEGISSRVLLSDYYSSHYITAKRVF